MSLRELIAINLILVKSDRNRAWGGIFCPTPTLAMLNAFSTEEDFQTPGHGTSSCLRAASLFHYVVFTLRLNVRLEEKQIAQSSGPTPQQCLECQLPLTLSCQIAQRPAGQAMDFLLSLWPTPLIFLLPPQCVDALTLPRLHCEDQF